MAARRPPEPEPEDELQDEELPPEEAPDRTIRSAPWWAVSIALHAVILIIATIWVVGSAILKEELITIVQITPRKIDEIEFERPRDVFENKKPIKNEQPSKEDPVFIKDAEESDHNETDNNEEFQQAKGESKDFLSDKPFKGEGVYDTIGIGGGGGGKYGGRLGGKRNLVARGGGSEATESAVLAALRWLARHQDADGHWGCRDFSSECNRVVKEGGKCGGPGYEEYDVGVTSLSLLAFLGAGYTHLSKDTYDGICFGTVVKKGIQWLTQTQTPEGAITGKSSAKYMYNHAVAALALAEAYGLTGSPLFKEQAQKAIDYLIKAQNPYKAWRYTEKSGDNDTSVSGWAIMALKSADISGLNVPKEGYSGGKAWLDECTGDDFRAGYTERGTGKVAVQGQNEKYDHHEALTAVAIMARIFIDKNRNDPRLSGGAKLIVSDLPEWDGWKIDYYYWYYSSLALFQLDGPSGPFWKAWNEKMKSALVTHQKTRKDGCANGSWDTAERWSFEGGRVYATAINALTLEVYYRYENVFGVR